MTSPDSVPQLSTSVVDNVVDSTVTRIGVVTTVVESDSITVAISGSGVLIQAAYLFPQYEPLLGDRVVVQRQGAAWFVLGTLSGPINTTLLNPSFEIGIVGTLPDSWTIQVISSVAGVPTLTIANGGGVSGSKSADFGTDSVGAGTSEAYALSTPVGTAENTRWTAALYFKAFLPGPPNFSTLELFIQFLDASQVLISETMVAFADVAVDQLEPVYLRLNTNLIPAGAVVAPVGTGFVRMKVRGIFRLPAASFASFFLDYMILRQV